MNKNEAYLIGAFGDAYLDFKRNEVQFYQKDKQWLDYINEILFEMIGQKGRIFKRDVFLLRKTSKKLFLRIKEILSEPISHGESFVAGLFDSEGSLYLSTKSKIPVADITQSEKGKHLLEQAQRILSEIGIKSFLNGPYKHWNSNMPTYHLRIYGKQCYLFFSKIPIKHPEKREKFSAYL